MEHERTKKTTQNMAMGFAGQLVALLLSFVSRTVFLRTLGVEYLGLNSIFADVLALLSMADLGLGTAMSYTFYKPLAARDEDKIAALTHFYRRVYRAIALGVGLIGLAVTPFLPYIVNTEAPIPHLTLYYLLALAGVSGSYLFVYKTNVLIADQKNYLVTRIGIWTQLLRTTLQIAALALLGNYILYLAIGVVLQLAGNWLTSRRAQREHPCITRRAPLPAADRKGIFTNMRSVFLYKVSGTLFSATDNLLVSVLLGTAMVGVYANYMLASTKLLLVIQIVFSALTASVGNLLVTEAPGKRYEVFCAAQAASNILCGVITCLFYLLASDFILVWLGPGYLLPHSVVLAVSLNTYLSCILQPLWLYRDAAGLYMKTKYVMLLGAVLNLILSVALGLSFGLAGIIFASAIARLCTYFWVEPRLLYRETFARPVRGYYLNILANAALVAGCAAGLRFAFRAFTADSWPRLLLKGAVCGCVCGALFLLVYARTAGGRFILEKTRVLAERGRVAWRKTH